MKNYFPLFIFSMMFYQTYAMQQPQQTKKEKLENLLEKFGKDCELECFDIDNRELRIYCYNMCRTLNKTFKEYNKILSEDK